MNEYWLENMDESVPTPSTSTDTMKRYIKDKYVKSKWASDDENPVILFQSGKLTGKKKKSKKKKRKRSEDDMDTDSEPEERASKKKKKKSKKRKKEKEADLLAMD